MSDTKEAEAPAAPGAPKGPLILALVNTLAVLGAAGMLYYTKVVFKRPAITEETERKRLEALKAKEQADLPRTPGLVVFEPANVNIEPYGGKPGEKEGQLRYATIGFSLEIRDFGQKEVVESVRPVIVDKLLQLLAHKPFHELNTVQGRYVLRTQIMEIVNQVTASLPSRPAGVPAPPAPAGGGGHGGGHGEAPPAEGGHGGGHGEAAAPAEGGHGGGGHGGGGHGEAVAEKPAVDEHGQPLPPIGEVFREGLVSNVYFTQFIVQ